MEKKTSKKSKLKTSMVKKEVYQRYPRRKLDTKSITIPDCSLSARVLIDRCAKGLPVNAKMSKHIPLPPDGLDASDFETGTEEILDVVDAVAFSEEIVAKQKHIENEKEKAREALLHGEQPGNTTSPTSSEAQN